MNQYRIVRILYGLLFQGLSMACAASTNQVFVSTGDGAVLTAPWIYDQTALTNFTISAWVSVDGTTSPTDRVIVERAVLIPSGNPISFPQGARLNFRLGINQQGHPYASFHGSGHDPIEYRTFAESETLAGGQWTHMAAEYDSTYLKLYRNGRLVSYNEFNQLPCNGWFSSASLRFCFPGTITIGAGNSDPTGVTTNLNSFFSGRIDEVVVWNGALTDAAINTWMNRKPSGINPNLLAYWSFDDGLASDASTNGVNGTFFQSTSSVERIISLVTLGMNLSTDVVINFQTVQDALYMVEVSTNLMETNWSPVVTNVLGTGYDWVMTTTNSALSRFFRVWSY